MAERKKKSSWVFPTAGPGTFSGFFVAWVFVGGIIGLALILMAIGKGPIPLRVVGYDLGLEGRTLAEVNLDKLTTAINQANPMVLALQGTSEEITKELRRKKEENATSGGSSAILSRYRIEKSEGGRLALIHFGKGGRFGVINVDLRKGAGDTGAPDLKEAAAVAGKEFGETPHAIFALAGDTPPEAPAGYLDAPATNKTETQWRVFIPETIKENLRQCYVPAENEKIKDFSDRLPIVARFVFREKDFE